MKKGLGGRYKRVERKRKCGNYEVCKNLNNLLNNNGIYVVMWHDGIRNGVEEESSVN